MLMCICIVRHSVYVCVCPMVLLTCAGGAWSSRGGPSASTHQQGFLVFSQSLLSQVVLPLDFQLQGLGDVRYDPVDGSQYEEHHMLQVVNCVDITLRKINGTWNGNVKTQQFYKYKNKLNKPNNTHK